MEWRGLGKYYSMWNGNLYIYVTEGDEMIDLRLFPTQLNLFDAESSWRTHGKIAIVNDAEGGSLDMAEIILKLKGFKRRDLKEKILENYFSTGDEAVLEGIFEVERHPPTSRARIESREGIIIPKVISPLEDTVSTISPDIPRERPTPKILEPLEVRAKMMPEKIDETWLIEYLVKYIDSRGYNIPESIVKNYWVSLKTKPFVVLSGYSDTGKTALTRLMAEALSDDIEEQYLRIPVQPSWLDDKSLFGFYNPITQRYVSTPFLNFLIKAVENPIKPYFLCLEGMNRSRVEFYFSRIFSAINSLDKEIHLHGIKEGVYTKDGKLVAPKVKMPDNLFVTGIINIDEFTHIINPRMLNIANVIEFSEIDSLGLTLTEKIREKNVVDMKTLNDFKGTLQQWEREYVHDILVEINNIADRHGRPISYKMRQDILKYVANSKGVYSDMEEENLKTSVDIQIKQKVLTKISGTESIRILLEDFKEYLGSRMPMSAIKVERMLERLEEFGFTSFYL